jgi:hypothetical protein
LAKCSPIAAPASNKKQKAQHLSTRSLILLAIPRGLEPRTY